MNDSQLKEILNKVREVEDKTLLAILERIRLRHEQTELQACLEETEKKIEAADAAIELLADSIINPLGAKK